MVDIEADGPIPGDYSMLSIGAVVVEPGLARSFYAELRPISAEFVPAALEVCGFTRAQTEGFDDPAEVMARFAGWLADLAPSPGQGRHFFVSDNNGFDWGFVNWYFHHFTGSNPFGHSSTNLGSLYKGLVRDTFQSFKHLRRTTHTHNALDDARGNAEALLTLARDHGLKIRL